MLSPEQLAEGRRLLAEYESAGSPVHAKIILALEDWLWEHRNALLAEPPIADLEAIKRGAVRQFAESLRLSFRCRAEICRNSGLSDEHKFWELHALRELSEVCNRKGINQQ